MSGEKTLLGSRIGEVELSCSVKDERLDVKTAEMGNDRDEQT